MRALLSRAGIQPIVLEPDAGNESSIELFTRLGATLGPVVAMPPKTPQFAFLDWGALGPAAGEQAQGYASASVASSTN